MACKWIGFAALFLGAIAQDTPTIGFISPDVVTDIGGNVELVCRIENENEYPVLWMRFEENGKSFPISTGQKLFISDSRFSLSHDKDSGTYTLAINKVEASDAAKYQCQVVIGLNNMITADILLQVRLPPVIKEEGQPYVKVAAGEEAELPCSATGFPSPKLTWSREDLKMVPTDDVRKTETGIVLKKTRMEDRGSYICTADNGVGKSQQRTVTLEVEFAPLISVPRPRVAQAPYYDAELECEITGFPPAAINWKKGDVTVQPSSHYDISHFAKEDEVTRSTLKIYSVTREDFTDYTCEASNRHGSASGTMELYESTIPVCPPVCGSTDLYAGAATPLPISPLLIAISCIALRSSL